MLRQLTARESAVRWASRSGRKLMSILVTPVSIADVAL